MAFNFSPKIVTSGLVLYLDAANTKSYPTTGTTWSDLTINNNNGTLTNGPTFNSSNGGSIVFDGVNDYGTIPFSIQNQFTNQISICSWVNPQWFDSGNNDGVAIIGKTTPSLANPFTLWSLTILPSGNIAATVGDGINRSTLTSSLTVSLNTWAFICFTYNGSVLRIYKNGVEGSNTASGTYTLGKNNVNPSIGGWLTLGTFFDWYKGSISYIQLYNRALSASEIQQNFNATRGRFGIT